MTPLAQIIIDDIAKPEREHRFTRNGIETNVPDALLGAHAFDLTAVHDMVAPLGLKMSERQGDALKGIQDTRLAFLPAPTTWIEYRLPDPEAQRHGVLLMDAGDFAVGVVCVSAGGGVHAVAEVALPLSGSEHFGELRRFAPKVAWVSADWVEHMCRDTYAMLAIINSPRVIGRREHMPHAGLQKRIAKARGMVGKYPLHAWHEVVLDVTPPEPGPGGHEGRLTGGKALHFCRQHLRVQNGKLVLVSAHWRGDPALGMKQTRYRVAPPKPGH